MDRPAHPVVVADEGVQGHVGEDVVKAGGVLGDAPMDVGHRPFAVAGKLPGQIHHIRFRYIRQLGPLGELAGADGFPENLEHALHLDALDFGVHQQVALHRVGLAVGVEGLGRAAGDRPGRRQIPSRRRLFSWAAFPWGGPGPNPARKCPGVPSGLILTSQAVWVQVGSPSALAAALLALAR